MNRFWVGIASVLMITSAASAESRTDLQGDTETTNSNAITEVKTSDTKETPQWQNPSVPSEGRDAARSGFISYDIREDAEKGVRSASPFYMPLKMQSPAPKGNTTYYIAQATIPYGWLDRDVFIHVDGAEAFYLYINDKKVGFGTDAKAPSEFNISKYITDGLNTFRVESMSGSSASELEPKNAGSASGVSKRAPLGDVFLYSQPKLRIADFTIVAEPDSLGKNGLFKVEIVVSNSYNATEPMTVGYDIYSPIGKLQYYDMKDAKLSGRSTDTVRFKESIGGVMQNLWSAESPKLYRVMIYVKRAGRMIEYIPLKIGFGTTEFRDGQIVRNGKPIAIKAVRYNVAQSSAGDANVTMSQIGSPLVAQTRSDLVKLKSHGVNTISVDYPQVNWFYDLCDEVGIYVIDQANLNNSVARDNLKIGGTTSNDPQWLNSYLERAQSMYERSRNHTSIVAWSLGGESGNGYNMYRAYQWLKGVDPVRAVIYRDADGEWNTDMEFPELIEADVLLSQPAPVKKSTKRR